jgi:acyl dehydratase
MTTPVLGPGVILGSRVGPFEGRLDAEHLRRFAAATNDRHSDARTGRAPPVPPLAVILLLWEPQGAGRLELVPARLQDAATVGVHGEHDVVLHRPIIPDEPLTTWVEGTCARPAGRNSAVTLHYLTLDAGGALVAEQWWTTVWLGVVCEAGGSPPPGHTLPDTARFHPLGRWCEHVDEDMARRYAIASGDWSAHHFEVEAARRSGSDRVFLHGLCTMALSARAVVEILGCPAERVRRVAVRFARPMPVREQLDVHVYDPGDGGYVFEATWAGGTVLTHGRVELG